MPTYRLTLVSEAPRSCVEVEHEGLAGSGPDVWTALRMLAHALDRRAREGKARVGVREQGGRR